jgi:hypothetical protein
MSTFSAQAVGTKGEFGDRKGKWFTLHNPRDKEEFSKKKPEAEGKPKQENGYLYFMMC